MVRHTDKNTIGALRTLGAKDGKSYRQEHQVLLEHCDVPPVAPSALTAKC